MRNAENGASELNNVKNGPEIRIGWIGTGVMGSSMAGRLLDSGYYLSVHSRTRSKSETLLQRGAHWCESPAETAAASDIVFTMVGFPGELRQIVFGENGILAGWSAGSSVGSSCGYGSFERKTRRVLIDCTTSSPNLAREIFAECERRAIDSLDAPVSGGDIGAKNGTLSIMLGGARSVCDSQRELLSHLGTNIVYQGPAGSGQHTKMANQILIAGNMIGVCEALLYAYQMGLNLDTVLESVSSGAAGSWSLSNLAPRILQGNFQPGFYVEHFVKDLGIALEESRRMNIQLPGVELAYQLYTALQEQGDAKLGTQALIRALARLSRIALPEDGKMEMQKSCR